MLSKINRCNQCLGSLYELKESDWKMWGECARRALRAMDWERCSKFGAQRQSPVCSGSLWQDGRVLGGKSHDVSLESGSNWHAQGRPSRMEQDGHERSFRGRKAYLRTAGQTQLPEAGVSGVGEKGCYRCRARENMRGRKRRPVERQAVKARALVESGLTLTHTDRRRGLARTGSSGARPSSQRLSCLRGWGEGLLQM